MGWYEQNRVMKRVFEIEVTGMRKVCRPGKKLIHNCVRNSGTQGCDWNKQRRSGMARVHEGNVLGLLCPWMNLDLEMPRQLGHPCYDVH